MAADHGSGNCVFSPGLRLAVAAETGTRGEEIHLHPGGQGYWLARSIERLAEPVVLCATVGGEVGDVLTPLLRPQTGIELIAVDRHAVNKLYSLTLAHAIGRGCCVLAGNIDTGTIPPSYYGLSVPDRSRHADHRGRTAPSASRFGQRRHRTHRGDEDLRDDRAIGDDLDDGLVAAVGDLANRVSHHLVVTRGPDRPAVVRDGCALVSGSAASTRRLDWRSAGDAMAGAMAVAYVRGLTGVDPLRVGAAEGAASVTRRGLASFDCELVDATLPHVRVGTADDAADALTQ